jgi:hypothetical protein
MPHKKCHEPPQNSVHLKFLLFYLKNGIKRLVSEFQIRA